MKSKMFVFGALAAALCIGAGAVLASGKNVDASIAQLRLRDLSGHPVSVKATNDLKAVVFLFVSVECPISNSYAPEFRRLAAEFGPKHVEFMLVYPNLDEKDSAIAQHQKEFDLPMAAWRDPYHELVKSARVRITPEAAVFAPGVGFVYHGRIDNRFADLGVARPQATERDLHDVLAAIIAGKPVPHRSAKAIGCSISPPP